jgi:hypothetical protein
MIALFTASRLIRPGYPGPIHIEPVSFAKLIYPQAIEPGGVA